VKEFIEKQQVKHIHLSISHVKEMASAFVVLEK
jgi:phosphopantetheinyl transferase (holo-ACP synthase)